MQARAAGVRCGDGSDPHSLAARTFHRDTAKSLPETQQLCPGLITKPMRSDRYRQVCKTLPLSLQIHGNACHVEPVASSLQVSAQILGLISQHATNRQCERTSYDDFYLEVVPADAQLSAIDGWKLPNQNELHILGDIDFTALPAVLKCAVQVIMPGLSMQH